jgi:hypothetical protein
VLRKRHKYSILLLFYCQCLIVSLIVLLSYLLLLFYCYCFIVIVLLLLLLLQLVFFVIVIDLFRRVGNLGSTTETSENGKERSMTVSC